MISVCVAIYLWIYRRSGEGRERVGRRSGEGRERVGRGSAEDRERIGRGSGEGRERIGRGSGEDRERVDNTIQSIDNIYNYKQSIDIDTIQSIHRYT